MTVKMQNQRNRYPHFRTSGAVLDEVAKRAGIQATDRLVHDLQRGPLADEAPLASRTIEKMVAWYKAQRVSPAWGALQAYAAAMGVLVSELDQGVVLWSEHVCRAAPDFNGYLAVKLAIEYSWRESKRLETGDLDVLRDRAAWPWRDRKADDWLNAIDAHGLPSPTQEAAERVRQLAERAKVVLELEAAGGRYAEVITGRVWVRMPSLQADAIADQEP